MTPLKWKGWERFCGFRGQQRKTNEWVLNNKSTSVNRELLDTVEARKLAYYGHTMRKQGSCLEKDKEQYQVHAGEEDHARPGWTTSIRGQDYPWKSQFGWQRTEINGESTSMVWPTLVSRTAREQNRTEYSLSVTALQSPFVRMQQSTSAVSASRLKGFVRTPKQRAPAQIQPNKIKIYYFHLYFSTNTEMYHALAAQPALSATFNYCNFFCSYVLSESI